MGTTFGRACGQRCAAGKEAGGGVNTKPDLLLPNPYLVITSFRSKVRRGILTYTTADLMIVG